MRHQLKSLARNVGAEPVAKQLDSESVKRKKYVVALSFIYVHAALLLLSSVVCYSFAISD